MKIDKTTWTIVGLAILVAITPRDIRMTIAAVIGSDYWSELWPYLVVYLGALAGYFVGPDIRRWLTILRPKIDFLAIKTNSTN